ncbi:hypothetical protein ACFP3I_02270 [Chryseobacterium arachidis]
MWLNYYYLGNAFVIPPSTLMIFLFHRASPYAVLCRHFVAWRENN